jgi:hypothetical protein
VLRLANGELRTISQGDDVALPVGARAFIVYGARARVIPRE